MKQNKLIFGFMIFCSCVFSTLPAAAYNIKENSDEYMFVGGGDVIRGLIWGLTPEIIMEEEKATFVGREVSRDKSRVIFFIDKIWGVRHTIGYEFDTDSKLSKVKLFNEKKYNDPNDRMEDLLTLQNYLTLKYGEPLQENFYWRRNEQRTAVEDWGWSLYRGNLAVEIIWQTAQSNITISLKSPEPLNPTFTVIFEDRNAADIRNLIQLEEQKPKPLISIPDFEE